MLPRTPIFAMVLAVSAAVSGCGGGQCECTVDEERIAQRVAELIAERDEELADEGEGDDDGGQAGDGVAGGGSARPHAAGAPSSAPPPVSPPVAAVPFSDPVVPAAPAPGRPSAPFVRPSPGTAPAAAEPRVWIPVGRSPSRGPAGALVTLVIFTDFECPFCSRLEPTIEELRGRYPDELRVVFKQFPLAFHPRAMPAAEAAVEAFVQGGNDAFWRMHDLLFANQRALSSDDFVRYASAIGLDAGRLAAAVESDLHRPAVEADTALGTASGVTGTPTVFLNGTRLVGARPLDALVTAVEAELVVARAELARGTPRARIYETIVNGAARRPRGPR